MVFFFKRLDNTRWKWKWNPFYLKKNEGARNLKKKVARPRPTVISW